MPVSQHSSRGAGWKATRLRILERDAYTCWMCGGEADQVDHRLAKSKGGADTDDNLSAACARCNNSKSDAVMVRTPYWDTEYLANIV
ncbi:HNH endonuclease [Oerskovia sp. NPDC060338]|uniref:HNH endonuclease n=1 Tax=Oerskovia sp. NPDC060338 TaxID=3347100 RepID=UPI0036655B24